MKFQELPAAGLAAGQLGRRPTDRRFNATFGAWLCYGGVNKYLKIFLLVVAALVAIKLLPLTIALGFVLGLLLVGLLLLGLSLIAAVAVAAIALAAILAPIWIPVLLVVAVIALIKRLSAKPAAA